MPSEAWELLVVNPGDRGQLAAEAISDPSVPEALIPGRSSC